MSTQSKVAVVILCWNGRKFLEQFLPSVTKTSYANTEIVVADNNSSDDSVAFVKAKYPTVRIIEIDKNEGFATGYNKALAQVKADYYVLLNQDVEVEPGWLEPMVQMVEEDNQIAIVQPKLRAFHQKDFFEYAGAAGGFIDIFGYTFCRGRIFDELEKDEGQYDRPTEIFWASGAAMFIHAELYHKLGGLDDDFFAHMEEIDLCWRIKDVGYKIKYCPDAVVYHVGGGSLPQGNPRKTFLNFRNNFVMMIKNLPGHTLWWKLPIRLLLDQVAALQALLKGNTGDFLAIEKATRQNIFKLGRWLRKRKTVQAAIRENAVRPFNRKGMYSSSIIISYFLKGKKRYSEL